jgi:hypothetical protein
MLLPGRDIGNLVMKFMLIDSSYMTRILRATSKSSITKLDALTCRHILY